MKQLELGPQLNIHEQLTSQRFKNQNWEYNLYVPSTQNMFYELFFAYIAHNLLSQEKYNEIQRTYSQNNLFC